MKHLRFLITLTALTAGICLWAQKNMRWSENYGKSIAVFGGSFSIHKESDIAKNYWVEMLHLKLTNYGKGGAGFSNLTQAHNIQHEIDLACAPEKPQYDIYSLWASTNDFTKANSHIGTPDDYTEADGFDTTKLKTQCGGINYCIRKIYQKNPKAKILFLTSTKCFRRPNSGTNPFYKGTYGMNSFVEAQIACCNRWGIPYLNQFLDAPFNEYNKAVYIKKDNLHLTEDGYRALMNMQASFIATH